MDKINFMEVFKSRTIGFNTVAFLLVYGATRFFPTVAITPLDVAAEDVGGLLQDSTRGADGASATLTSAQPKN